MTIVLSLRRHIGSRFQEEVGWAFKLFDVDNSGEILVSEIFDSVKVTIDTLDSYSRQSG